MTNEHTATTQRRSGRLPQKDADGERARRASFDPATGEVHGSGSGAGGGGNPREDYDSDAAGGGGAEPQGGPRTVDEATRRPRDKHQGDAA